jgi:RNA polymerase sigma-70 factor (ECF subfamily)
VSQDGEFDEMYAVLYPRVVRQVYAFTADLGEAQDCVQEAFTKALVRWPHLSQCQDPEAWVRTVAIRLSISRWRKARNAVTAWRRTAPAASLPELSPDHVALVAALRRIPVAQRQAIVLHHLVGLSVDEISYQTGSPTGTIKARLARGRGALAALLATHSSEASHG